MGLLSSFSRVPSVFISIAGAVFSFFLMLTGVVSMADENSSSDLLRVNIYYENDVLYLTDYGYSNGLKLALLYEVEPEGRFWFKLPFIDDASKKHYMSFSVSQLVFTPRDIEYTFSDESDRPYAGILYGSYALHQSDEKELDSLELQMGVVGPSSYGSDVQNFVHGLIGSPHVEGWDCQLQDEFIFLLAYQHRWRSIIEKNDDTTLEMIPYGGGAVGNMAVYANAGLMFRYGWNVPEDFGTTSIQGAEETGIPALGKNEKVELKNRWSSFFQLYVEGVGVAHNITLDGNSFSDEPSVEKEPFIGKFGFSYTVRYGHYHFSLANINKTKVFKSQHGGYGYGSVVFSYIF